MDDPQFHATDGHRRRAHAKDTAVDHSSRHRLRGLGHMRTRQNQEDPPMKPLSEQLTDLAARAKKTEDFVASAQESNRKQLEEDRADLKTAIAAGKANAQQDVAMVKQETSQALDEVGSSIDHWLGKVRAAANERRSERKIKRAQRDAEVSEDVAAGAIDFAIFAMDQAEYAVSDAVLTRADADAMAESS
jgi:hypothetical protein